ncbi:trypsin-7-like [Periplaneta americana]|uniref:trypsin-7-like n=1 Tax=Periplaneta americana TaxID=6978 RepID=UPI0037E9534F
MIRLVICSLFLAGVLGAVPIPRRLRSNGRIVGGTDADIANYPYQVSMQVNNGHFCGGSIISTEWVVTAAHCVKDIPINVVSFRAGSSNQGTGGTVHPAEQITYNPNFSEQTADYDIAVAKVSVLFVFSNTVQPIKFTSVAPPTGTPVVVTGWGALYEDGPAPEVLQQVQINIVDFEECDSVYGGITQRMICAGVPQGGKGVCGGDSGGPLVANGSLVGVVSWGAFCAAKGYPQVFSDVAVLSSWVTFITGVS